MEIEVLVRDIEDLAKLEVTFDSRKIAMADWNKFMALFKSLFWIRDVGADLPVMGASDALADIQNLRRASK